MRYVECRWYDAYSSVNWTGIADELQPVTCITRGWLVKEGVDYYVIAGTMQEEHDIYGEVIAIPSGCVISLENFSGPAPEAS